MADEKPLVIFGTGDFARIAAVYLEHDGDRVVTAFAVDRAYLDRDSLLDRPVVAFENLLELYPPDTHDMLVAIGFSKVNRARAEACERARALGYTLATYISPRAQRAPHVTIGDNCFIFEDNVLQPFVTIGNNVVLWSGNHIGHDATIEDHCFLASHVVVSGNVTVRHHCFVGVSATFRDKVVVAPHCVIGAGALIMRDTEEGEVYAVRGTEPISKRSWEINL